MLEEDSVGFDSLEERIVRVVELVNSLRKEKQALATEVEQAVAARDAARREASEAKSDLLRCQQELEALRSERKQVRTRIEKLLGQMDLLANQ